jgi:hypothetical protein
LRDCQRRSHDKIHHNGNVLNADDDRMRDGGRVTIDERVSATPGDEETGWEQQQYRTGDGGRGYFYVRGDPMRCDA